MKKRRKPAPAAPETRFVKLSSDRRIILLDQTPLREEAGRTARKKIGEMHKLVGELEEFEKTILPAYERWETAVLGPLLMEERQLHAKIAHLERIIHRASLESLFTGRGLDEIFAEAESEMKEWDESQANGDNEPSRPEPEPAPDFDPDKNFPDEEREFRTYVRFAAGDDPDKFTKREYKKLFNEYREWKQKREHDAASLSRQKQDVPARVKELYRVLVRRLHPDTGKSRNDPNTRRLWHDLQNAYAEQDVERLEVLLAMTDLHESGSAIRSTLFHLRKVAKQMERTVRDLKTRIREARSSPAWTFWHSENREKTAAKFRTAIEGRIRDAKNDIRELEKEITFWSTKTSRHNKEEAKTVGKITKKAPPVFGDVEPNSNSQPPDKRRRVSKDQGFFDF